jgi:heme ABC exporter ATP-binding subunit CcmA
MNAVAVEGVWKFFGDFPALRDVNLTIAGGSCTALIGRNGAGKTTLLRILAGLSRPAKGQVTLDGMDVRDSRTRSQVGVLGHGIGIYDELTALENLKLFGSLYGVEQPRQSALDWLDRVGLQHVKDAPVREYSRGMRQRLAVARAFLHDPRILLLDEPFTALDDRAIAVLQSVLRRALEEGRTVIMSTHQLREALELATNVALLVRGKMAHSGVRTPEMLADPGWLYREYGEA